MNKPAFRPAGAEMVRPREHLQQLRAFALLYEINESLYAENIIKIDREFVIRVRERDESGQTPLCAPLLHINKEFLAARLLQRLQFLFSYIPARARDNSSSGSDTRQKRGAI